MNSVNVGVIGAGIISDVTLNGYAKHPASRVVAVCDIDESRARVKAKKWGAKSIYTSSDELRARDIGCGLWLEFYPS